MVHTVPILFLFDSKLKSLRGQDVLPIKLMREKGESALHGGWSRGFFATGHDGGVKAFLNAGGKFVNLVRAIDFDGFAGGVEDHFAVRAAAKMSLQFGACFRGD